MSAPEGSLASSTVPSAARGSLAGSAARTTTSSWASAPVLRVSKVIVPAGTSARAGITIHSLSSTAMVASLVAALPTGRQGCACPEAVPLPDPVPLAAPEPPEAVPLPLAWVPSTLRTPAPSSDPQPAASARTRTTPSPASPCLPRFPTPRPPELGIPKSTMVEPTQAGQRLSSPGGRPGRQGDQPGRVQRPGPPAHGQVVGQGRPPGPVQRVGGGREVDRPADPAGGALGDQPGEGQHPAQRGHGQQQAPASVRARPPGDGQGGQGQDHHHLTAREPPAVHGQGDKGGDQPAGGQRQGQGGPAGRAAPGQGGHRRDGQQPGRLPGGQPEAPVDQQADQAAAAAQVLGV